MEKLVDRLMRTFLGTRLGRDSQSSLLTLLVIDINKLFPKKATVQTPLVGTSGTPAVIVVGQHLFFPNIVPSNFTARMQPDQNFGVISHFKNGPKI